MSFHQYRINELYSNADGQVQFIEMAVGNVNGESFWSGQSISVSRGGVLHSFTFPGQLPSQLTANTKVLIATQGFANLGTVTPDFIIPAGFLFVEGGTVNFAGVDSVSYTSLPSGGSSSLDRNGSASAASPTNFAGVSAAVSLPGSTGESRGTAGNDSLRGTSGNDTIDGGGGIDTVRYNGAKANFTLTRQGNDSVMIKDNTGAEGTDTLLNIERLQFSDKSVALDVSGNGGQVYRLYQAAFDRKPDSGGLGDWIFGMDQGTSLTDVAGGFVASPEFTALYGANPSTADLVNRLYQNVLHRVPEKAGFDYWANQLDSGLQSKAQALAGFSESPENQAQLIGQIQNGFDYTLHT